MVIISYLFNFERIKDMSKLQFDVKVYDESDDLVGVYVFDDEKYDILPTDEAMNIAKSAATWITPEKGRATVERINEET